MMTAKAAIRHYHIITLPDLTPPTDDRYVVWYRAISKKKPITAELAREIFTVCLWKSLSQLSLLELRTVLLFSVIYFCCACFEEAADLETENVRRTPSGHLEILFLKAKNNQFKDCRSAFLSPCEEATQFCPVRIITAYKNQLAASVGSHFQFPSFTGSRNLIPGSKIS